MKNEDPAFPIDGTSHYGMTLREYFAAKAMAATIANQSMLNMFSEKSKGDSKAIMPTIAIWSYSFADAMLKVRDQ